MEFKFYMSGKAIVFCAASLWMIGLILSAANNDIARKLIAKQFAFMHEMNTKLDISTQISAFNWLQNDTQEDAKIQAVDRVAHSDKFEQFGSEPKTPSDFRSSWLPDNILAISQNLLQNPRNAYTNKISTFTDSERRRWNHYAQTGLDRTGTLDLTEYFRDLVLFRKITSVFDLIDNAKYDHFDELKASQASADQLSIKLDGGFDNNKQTSGANNNQKMQGECIRQLSRFVERASKVLNETETSEIVDDYNMLLILDSFGQLGAGLSGALLTWTGDYDSCREATIRDPRGELPDSATRFCWAGVKPAGAGLEQLIMSGVCLPVACDSSNYENKFELLLELVRLRVPRLKRVQLSMDRLYCLPDEKSPLRSVQSSVPTMLYLCLVFSWLSYLVYCTIKFRRNKISTFYASLSIENNLKSLFKLQRDSTSQAADNEQEVDFSCLGGIKVLCSSYIMMGHVMMCLTLLIKEGRSLMREHATFVLSNQMPAFAVNPFFCITGLLTCYQILQQNKRKQFVNNPSKWLAITIFRYVRIMPVYLLVVGYAKLVAKYTNEGPYWDYATSDKSMRRRCEEESWLATLLFSANFKHPFDHCIPSAWYLANDFQFFLVTPFLLALLHWKPKLGRLTLMLGTLASFISGFASIYFGSPDQDLTPIANFQPHAFKVYLTYFTKSYTYPQNRISAYFIGLFLGHELYQYTEKRLKTNFAIEESSSSNTADQNNDKTKSIVVADSEHWWSKWAMKLSLLSVILLWIIPKVGARLPLSAWQSRLLFSFIMPSYHVLIATSVGALILAIATGKRRNLLTDILGANFWKPLSRMSLSVVLINIEVINYIIQGQRHSIHFDNHRMIMYLLYSIFSVYLFAIPFTVLFEAPLRGLLNIVLEKASISLKQQTKQTNQKKLH